MTDIARGHGGDCRGGPPGGGPPDDDRWLPIYGCHGSGGPTRGKTRNKGLKENLKRTDTHIMPVDFEIEGNETFIAVGPNGDAFNTLVGTIVSKIPAYYASWKTIPIQHRTMIIPEIESFFDMSPHLQGPSGANIEKGIITYCKRRYRGQKNKFKAEWFDSRGGLSNIDDLRNMPPPNIQDNDWNMFLDRMASPDFQKRSATNKSCRAKQKITVHQGRKSMAQNRYANRDPLTLEPPSPLDEYRRLRSRGGNFTNAAAAENYARMIAMKEAQTGLSDPMSDQEIMETVLGARRGWTTGIGQKLPQSHASSSSTSQTSKRVYTQDEVSRMMDDVETRVEKRMRKEMLSTMKTHTAPLFRAMTEQGFLPDSEDDEEDQEDEES